MTEVDCKDNIDIYLWSIYDMITLLMCCLHMHGFVHIWDGTSFIHLRVCEKHVNNSCDVRKYNHFSAFHAFVSFLVSDHTIV